jgi:chromosome segregation ATPase
MSEEKIIYVYNKHKAPIIVHTRDGKGKVLTTVTFAPERNDPVSGRKVTTGYTSLKEAEYEKLCETSKTFKHYMDKLKLLVVQDELPPEAKTPHEALTDARRKEREALTKIAALETEITGYKAQLLDAETKYKELQSASTDDEKLKSLNDKIASLEAECAELQEAVAEQRPPEDKTAELTEKLTELSSACTEFAVKMQEFCKKDKNANDVIVSFLAEIGK